MSQRRGPSVTFSNEATGGNTADVKSLLPVVEKLRSRFGVERFCIVADRGMISADTISALEQPDCRIPYILGTRMRRVKEVSDEVLARTGRYREVHPDLPHVLGQTELMKEAKSPAPLAVKEVVVEGRRYIVCRNSRQARKDAAARQAKSPRWKSGSDAPRRDWWAIAAMPAISRSASGP